MVTEITIRRPAIGRSISVLGWGAACPCSSLIVWLLCITDASVGMRGVSRKGCEGKGLYA
jgi:hypothetical protein